jgi:hypothetical protein
VTTTKVVNGDPPCSEIKVTHNGRPAAMLAPRHTDRICDALPAPKLAGIPDVAP